jgi:hypothetical protein
MAFPRTARHRAKAHERRRHSDDRFEVKWQILWLFSFGEYRIERLRATQLRCSHALHHFCFMHGLNERLDQRLLTHPTQLRLEAWMA